MAWLWKQGRPTLLALAGLGLLGYKALQRGRQEDVRGQVVLITGGSRGLGLALAREFARAGCRLVLCVRDPQELDHARRDLMERDAEVLTVPCDVADRTQVQYLIAQAMQRFGRVRPPCAPQITLRAWPHARCGRHGNTQSRSKGLFGVHLCSLSRRGRELEAHGMPSLLPRP